MKLVDFIVCEDVRKEIYDKTTLVGVYDDTMQFQKDLSWPKKLRLAFVARLLFVENDPIPESFKMIFKLDDKEFVEAAGKFEIPEPISFLTIPLQTNDFIVPKTGLLTFQLQLISKDTVIYDVLADYTLKIQEV